VFLCVRTSKKRDGLEMIDSTVSHLRGIIFVQGQSLSGAGQREQSIYSWCKSGVHDLSRQVERIDPVFTTRKAASTRSAAAPPRRCLAADPYKNIAQSRVSRIGHAVRKQFQADRCRVLANASRQDVHGAVDTPLRVGQSLQQGT